MEKLDEGRVVVKLPRIADDGSGSVNTTSHVTVPTSEEWLTQIKIYEPHNLCPTTEPCTWEVGQSDFNTEFASVILAVAPTYW
jgi:hypothetical protein